MRTAQHPHEHPAGTPGPRRPGHATAVATEVLLLRPRGAAEPESTLWPIVVMVLTEPTEPAVGHAPPLSELLARPGHAPELSAVPVEAEWSVLDPASALLALTVRAPGPVHLRIVLPAAPVLDVLDVVARGATIGITTRDRARGLRGGVDVRTALRDVVLLSCLPSAELTDLADVVRAAREG